MDYRTVQKIRVVAAPGVYCSSTTLAVEDRPDNYSEIPLNPDESSSLFFNNASSAEIFHELNRNYYALPGSQDDAGAGTANDYGYEEDDEESYGYM